MKIFTQVTEKYVWKLCVQETERFSELRLLYSERKFGGSGRLFEFIFVLKVFVLLGRF